MQQRNSGIFSLFILKIQTFSPNDLSGMLALSNPAQSPSRPYTSPRCYTEEEEEESAVFFIRPPHPVFSSRINSSFSFFPYARRWRRPLSLPPSLLPLPLRPPGTKDRGEGRKSLLEAIIARRAEREVSFPYSCSLCNVCLSTTTFVLFACFACHSPYKRTKEKKTVCVLKH